MYICKYCNKRCKNTQSITVHLNRGHNISAKDYYDEFLKIENEDICNHEHCNNKTNFCNIKLGYASYCSLLCANTSKLRIEQERDRMTKKYKDPNERKKLSEIIQDVYKDPNIRKKISDGVNKAHIKDPTIRDRMSKSIKSFYDKNPNERKKAGLRSKKMWKNPIIKQKIIDNLKETGSSEEYKNKKRDIANEIKKDPAWRKKVSEGTIKGWNKVPHKKEEQRQYMLNGGAAHCNRFIKNPSKPQIELYNKILKLCPYAILNYPCLNYSIDIGIPFLNIAIEYDGSYWHNDKEYDKKRDEQISNIGWNIFRFVDLIPDEIILKRIITGNLANVNPC